MSSGAASATPVQVLQSGVVIDPTSIAGLREEYAETGIAFLPGFLSEPVLDLVMKQVAQTELGVQDEVNKFTGSVFGTTRKASLTDPIITVLHFILNRPELFRLAADITDIARPGHFLCRLHRTEVAGEQHIDWHDDAVDNRVLGLDINLSDNQFEGGLFQMRGPDKRLSREIHFSAPGDAFLFRIGENWSHRLTTLEKGTRTVAVGWFKTKPNWEVFALPSFLNGRLLSHDEQGER